MPNRIFSARDVLTILQDKRLGVEARITAQKINASGGIPTTTVSVRDARRRFGAFPEDEIEIERRMALNRRPVFAGKTREEYLKEKDALSQRVMELTDAGMKRKEIAEQLGLPYSRIAYLRRYANGGRAATPRSPAQTAEAQDHRKPEERVYAVTLGPCLMCGRKFERSPINKVCGRCKGTEAWRAGA